MPNENRDMLQYVQVDDPKALGKLLCEYALGFKLNPDDTIPDLPDRIDVRTPATLQEFKADLERVGAGRVPDRVMNLKIVRAESDTFTLVLPPRDIAEQTIKILEKQRPGQLYENRISPFYREMLLKNQPWPNPEGMDHLSFWYCRVCDYTTSLCG